jgi:hypothetical protein
MSNKTTASITVEDTVFSMPRDGHPRRALPVLNAVLQNAHQLVDLSVEEKQVLEEVCDILENRCVNIQQESDCEQDYDHKYTITEFGVFENAVEER